MPVFRRSPIYAVVGGLLMAGILVTAAASNGVLRRAGTSCGDAAFGYQPGFGYGYNFDAQFGYGCPPPSLSPTVTGFPPNRFPPLRDDRAEDGYCLVTQSGEVFCLGDNFNGSLRGRPPNAPIVAVDPSPNIPNAYYMFAADGG